MIPLPPGPPHRRNLIHRKVHLQLVTLLPFRFIRKNCKFLFESYWVKTTRTPNRRNVIHRKAHLQQSFMFRNQAFMFRNQAFVFRNQAFMYRNQAFISRNQVSGIRAYFGTKLL